MPSALSRLRSVPLLALVVVSLLAGAAPAQADSAPPGATGRLSGVVQDDRGTALAGAELALTDATGAVVVQSATRTDGHYDIAVAPGTYSLAAAAGSDAAPARVAVPGVVVGTDSVLDVVIVGRAGGLADFRGRLVDTSGTPISGMSIGFPADASTDTDADGKFVLGIPRGRHNLTLRSTRFNATIADFDLTRDRIGDLSLPVVNYDLTLRDSAGAPLADRWVEISPAPKDGSQNPGLVATPAGKASWSNWEWGDSTGHAHLRGLVTPALTLTVHRRGTSESATVTVDGSHGTSLDVTVPSPSPPVLPATVRLSGTGTDVDGISPISPSVTLFASDGTGYWGQRDYAAGDSGFMVDAPVGTYRLAANPSLGTLDDWEGGDPEGDVYALTADGFRLDGSSRSIAIRLPAGPGVTVRVLDFDGAPVRGAVVTGTSSTPPGSTEFEIAPGLRGSGSVRTVRVTDDQGLATLRTLPGTASTALHVTAPSERGLSADLTVPAGPTADVQLKRGAVVSGTIRVGGHPGEPARHVTLVSDKGEAYGPISIGANGAYRLSVRPATYAITTDNDDDEPGGESDDHWNSTTDSSTFTVTGDKTLDVDYPATPSTQVRFIGADGAPLEGEIGLSSSSADNGLILAPGITASASAWFGSFGPRDREGIEVWPGGKVSGTLDSDGPVRFSDARLTPGGEAVVALAQGYSLAEPDPPASLTVVGGTDGTATISWDGTANGHGNPILGYQISLDSDTDARKLIVPAVNCVTVAGLAPTTRYRVYVSAMTLRGIGQSGESGLLDGTAAGGPQATTAPACTTTGGPTGPPAPDPATPGDGSPETPFAPSVTPTTSGYWALSSDGKVYNFGAAPHLGNAAAGAADLEPTPTAKGYWTLNRNGVVTPFGDAATLGNVEMARLAKGEEPASLSATPSGKGYWVFTNRGRVLAFGDATFLGDMSSTELNGPVLGSVATPSGRGYYMVASDGGIFAFGDATFAGSMGGKKLNAPVQSLVPDADGKGYWLVASDGGIFAFDAPFRGSMGGKPLNKPVVGMVRYGDGYLMVGADGGIFNFSTSPFAGSLGDKPPARPVVAVAALP